MANPTLDNLRLILQKEGLLNKTIPFQKRYEWQQKFPQSGKSLIFGCRPSQTYRTYFKSPAVEEFLPFGWI